MSRTLNLVDILLTTGRHLVLMGRLTEAITPLTKLAQFRKLPRHVLEELNSLLGDIYLQKRDFIKARRHLTAALAANPREADHHYRMAIAIDEDKDADRERAEFHYNRAVELEPEQAIYWADFGSYLFSVGKAKQALRAIRRAYARGINDAEIVGQVAGILRNEGHEAEATTKLRAALFQNHGDQRFRQLWQQHQFQLIYLAQERKRDAKMRDDVEPVILPFQPAPATGKYIELGNKTIRIDPPESLKEPQTKTPHDTQPHRRPQKG